MDKFLIILMQQKLYIYKSDNGSNFETFYVNGEKDFNWDNEFASKDFQRLREEILDVCNLEDLNQVSFEIIYNNVSTTIIRDISDVFLPCFMWKVVSFEDILPEILIKMKLIKPGKSVCIMFDNFNYQVSMSEGGYIKTNVSNDKYEIDLDINMILTSLTINYQFVTDENEIKKRDLEIIDKANHNKELIEKINLLESEIKTLNDKIIMKSKELTEKNKIIKNIERKSTSLDIARNRTIIRAEKPESNSSMFRGIAGAISSYTESLSSFYNTTSELKVKWKALNGNLVKSGEIIAMVGKVDSEGSIIRSKSLYSKINGRLYILVDSSEVKEGQILAVISDPGDSLEDIKQWVNKL